MGCEMVGSNGVDLPGGVGPIFFIVVKKGW